MAQGHSIDEYLETIYFLAFPIGEYTPRVAGSPPLASRVAVMCRVIKLHVPIGVRQGVERERQGAGSFVCLANSKSFKAQPI